MQKQKPAQQLDSWIRNGHDRRGQKQHIRNSNLLLHLQQKVAGDTGISAAILAGVG